MRPDPPDPSTHLKANSLPVTKRRAASAFMFCAKTGLVSVARKPATKAANRAIIPIPSLPNIVPKVLRNQSLITDSGTSVPNHQNFASEMTTNGGIATFLRAALPKPSKEAHCQAADPKRYAWRRSKAHGYSRLVSGPARAAIVEEQLSGGCLHQGANDCAGFVSTGKRGINLKKMAQ